MFVKVKLPLILDLENVRKSEAFFNMRLNNHRKDSKNKNPILACKHFQKLSHNFQRDKKFTLTEQITNNYQRVTAASKQTRKLLGSKTENTLPKWFKSRTLLNFL